MEKIYVTRPSLPSIDEYIAEIKDIWETGIMTHQGPKHVKLQRELEEYMCADNVTLFANGHLALELGLEVLGIKGEVITTPFTFGSTTQAILRNGCIPVFCDIKETDFTIDEEKIECLITDKTKAILPVHVYGNVCNVEKIQDIADKYGLSVIYDAAHAFGETYKGKDVSQYGDASMFSFHATKVFNTVEGGCLVYKNADYRQHLEGLRQFGQIVGTDSTPYIGSNAKMTEIHAAMGLCNLRHIEEYITKRKKIVDIYRERLKNVKGLRLSTINRDTKSNYAYFPLIIEEKDTQINRDCVIKALTKENIYVRKYFWPLCSDFEIIKLMRIDCDVPVARYISDRVITLPCYSDLSKDDAERICDIILNLYKGRI